MSVEDKAIADLVRAKMRSGNAIPVDRCMITGEEIDAALKAAQPQEAPSVPYANAGDKRQDVCVWIQDSDGAWDTSCQQTFEFTNDGPAENHAYFCYHCGGALLPEPYSDDDTAQPERVSVPVSDERKFWLWKNFVGGRPEYWAFDNPYPIHLHSDDPQTLGEPCGYAIFKESRTGRTDVSEAEVLSRIKKAAAQEGK